MTHLFVYLFFTVTTTDNNKNIPRKKGNADINIKGSFFILFIFFVLL